MNNIKEIFKKGYFQEYIDKTISGGSKAQIVLFLIVSVLLLLIFFSIAIFFSIDLGAKGDWTEKLWHVYNNFVNPGNHLNQEGWTNRIFAIIISFLGSIILGGWLISTLSNIIERRVDAIRSGKAIYKNISNHYVIIGFNEITVSVIKELYKEIKESAEERKILIMSSQEAEFIRHTLQSQLTKAEESIIKIYFGNIESEEELCRLNISRALEVYILGEMDEYGRDSKNIGCAKRINNLRGLRSIEEHLMPVYVQFDRISSYSSIQKLNIAKEMPNIYFRPFNFHENWARKLWSLYAINNNNDSEYSPNYEPLDYRPIQININKEGEHTVESQDFVHLVIVGFSKMGRALFLEALRICHYANYDDSLPTEKRIRTIITLIDKDMERMKNYFTTQFPHLESQIDDIKIEYRADDICNPQMREELTKWSKDKNRMLTIAICVSDPDISLSLGLNLPASIYENEARILIRQEIQTNLGQFIDEEKGRFKHVKIFGMLNQGIQKNMLQDELPSYINQYYKCEYCTDNKKGEKDEIKDCYKKHYCRFYSNRIEKTDFLSNLYKITKHIENDKNCSTNKDIKWEYNVYKMLTNKSWNSLNAIYRWANRYQLDAYPIYCRTLGYEIKVVNKDEETLIHNEEKLKIFDSESTYNQISTKQMLILMRMEKHRWNAERSIAGWRYGKNRDNMHLVHNLIIPFHQVPDDQKEKDRDVIKNIPYILALGGYQLEKNINSPND